MSQISLQLAEDQKTVFFAGKTYSYKDMIKAVPGKKWDKSQKRWELPLESVPDALRILPSLAIDPEVKRAHSAMKARHEKAVQAKDTSEGITKIKGLKGTLRSYQGQGVSFLDSLSDGEGGILAFDMGTGKSLTSLAYFQELKNRGEVDYALVVCPSPLKYATWAKEVAKWTELEVSIIDGDAKDEDGKYGIMVEFEDGEKKRLKGKELRAAQYQQYLFGADVIVMNYELFLHDMESQEYERVRFLSEAEVEMLERLVNTMSQRMGLAKTNKKVQRKAIAEMLCDLVAHPREYTIRGNKKPELVKIHKVDRIIPPIDERWMVILDEAHRIKNPKATTTKNLIEALKPSKRKVLGTGTPLENNIQELWTLVDFCRQGILGNYYAFLDRYIEVDYFGNPVAPKPQMMPELRKRIEPIMIRKTKQEAMPDLPPLTIQEYWVDMTKDQEKLYKAVKEGILQNAETEEYSYLEVIVQITRMQQLLDSPALLRELLGDPEIPIDSGKLNELPNIIADIDPERNKFILFSQYREMTDILVQWLVDNNVLPKSKIGYVRGGMKPQETERIRQAFQEGGMQCVVMTTAGNYGLDLYNAKYVVCFDQLFNPQKMEQIFSRAHRGGNVTGVTAINLVTRNSYEERKLRVLEQKREVFKAMVDADDETFAKLFSKEDLLEML